MKEQPRKTPLYLELHVTLAESNVPTEETPDNSPKLSINVLCCGRTFSTPWQAVSSVESREELVAILFEVINRKIVSNLDWLNFNAAEHRAMSTGRWVELTEGPEQNP